MAVYPLVALQVACSDPARSTQPGTEFKKSAAPAAASQSGGLVRQVSMHDACDSTTFNAAVEPGTCTRAGGVHFDKFIALLTRHQSVGAWRFAPPELHVRVGQTLLALNRGGEVHTFTEVEHFGGGIVPNLNQLSGNPVPVPECLNLEPDDFVQPGATYTDEVAEAGTELYQCWIHPWMRTTVHAR